MDVTVQRIPLPATVVFAVWGQQAETVFTADSELDPLTWIKTCYDYGFIYPVQILDANGIVLLDQNEILKQLEDE